MKIKIDSDVFEITKRLKAIDNSYFVLFNTLKNCYELHSENQPHTSFCLTLAFNCLDERTINLTLKTRSENRKILFEEIEKNNQKIMKNEHV